MDLAIRFGHIRERILIECLGYYRVGKRTVVAENVGSSLDKSGIKRKGEKEHWCKKGFTEDTKARGK